MQHCAQGCWPLSFIKGKNDTRRGVSHLTCCQNTCSQNVLPVRALVFYRYLKLHEQRPKDNMRPLGVWKLSGFYPEPGGMWKCWGQRASHCPYFGAQQKNTWKLWTFIVFCDLCTDALGVRHEAPSAGRHRWKWETPKHWGPLGCSHDWGGFHRHRVCTEELAIPIKRWQVECFFFLLSKSVRGWPQLRRHNFKFCFFIVLSLHILAHPLLFLSAWRSWVSCVCCPQKSGECVWKNRGVIVRFIQVAGWLWSLDVSHWRTQVGF